MQLRQFFPDIYQEIQVYADALPNHEFSPAHPFTGFVININVSTLGHRDRKDLEACMVLDIGEHEDGDLVLYEPGIVLPLRNGDVVLFFSDRLTHFNLKFIGKRASLVLHSDVSGLEWVKNCNGWEGNLHLF